MNARTWGAMLLLALVHLVTALVYHAEMLDRNKPWDANWQALPIDAMHADFTESMWYLHAQPPLFNAAGALSARLFPQSYMQVMRVGIYGLGMLLAALSYPVARAVIPRPWAAWLVALVFAALSPALALVEQLVFYTLPTAFLVTAGAACLVWHRSRPRLGYLVAFVALWAIIVLLRSAFHLVVMLPVVGFAAVLSESRWRHMLAVGALITLLPLGWYAKNQVEFGFFGASSWGGSNLWKIVKVGYSPAELEAFVQAGDLHPIATAQEPFSRPQHYVRFGFDQTSDVDVLSRNDYNNINMIDISAEYGRGAYTLIRREPLHYLRNVWRAYNRFLDPPYAGIELYRSDVLTTHAHIYDELMYGKTLVDNVNRLAGTTVSSWLVVLLPAGLLVYGGRLVWRCRLAWDRWRGALRRDPVMIYAAFVITYVTVVSSLFDYGENNRFKVMVEPLLWVFLIGLVWRLFDDTQNDN